MSFMIAIACGSRAPITTRSGRMKSPIAEPSRRNSGFDTTEKACLPLDSLITFSISCPVPIGTVDLVTTTLYPFMYFAIASATSTT